MAEQTVKALHDAVGTSVFLGAELDEKYRVLGITIEPAEGSDKAAAGDHRRQLLCFPVSHLTISLRMPEQRKILSFAAHELPRVTAALVGATVRNVDTGKPAPTLGQWGPQFSLDARSNAPDGRQRSMTLHIANDDAQMDLFVRCDHFELRDASNTVTLSTQPDLA